MRILAVGLMLLFCLCGVVEAQDNIQANPIKTSVGRTLGTGPGRILGYAAQIAYASTEAASAESVKSALDRLFAIRDVAIDFGLTAPGDADKVSGQQKIYFVTNPTRRLW